MFSFLFLFPALQTITLEFKPTTTTYKIHVKTGDKRGAGTDADVFIVFIGSKGESGKENLLV